MPTPSGAANRRLPLRLLTVAIVVTAGVIAWLSWSAYQTQARDEARRLRDARIEQMRSTLHTLNEKLSLTVQAAAESGNPFWAEQYRQDQQRRDIVLSESMRLSRDLQDAKSNDRIDNSYKRLVAAQAELFEHVAQGRAAEARALLTSQDYEQARDEFDKGLAGYFAWLQATDGAFPHEEPNAIFRYAAGAVALLFLIAGWSVVLVNMRRWQAELVLANDELARQTSELETLNANLDERVSRRTQELEESQAELARQTQELERTNADLTAEIAQRRQTEAALQREQDLLHALMDNIPDNIYFKDCEGRFLRINKAKALRTGLQSPEEAVNKTDFDFFPYEHAQKTHADEQALMESGEPLVGQEEQLVWPNGKVSWVSTTKTPFRDPNGAIVGTLGVSRDITAQKLAEETHRENAQRMRLILDTAREAFVGMDAHGRIVEWNSQAEAIFGWKREDVLGQLVADTIIPRQYRAAHVAGLLRFLKTGEGAALKQRIEITALRSDGSEFPVELSITPLKLHGEWSFYAFLHDITARKRNEEELRRAKDAAEAASHAKSDFLANMSHEIRTPMNAILGMTDLVLESELSEVQREYLKMVQSSGESLLTIINDILDFSKIEAGKLELAVAPFSLRRCVGDTLKSLALRAHGKNLELAWRVVEPTPDCLIGDADRLRQVLVNLVGNAIKFTDEGEVVLEVDCPARAADAAELHFQVRDTGIGVPPDKLQTIFEAFEQADMSSTRHYGGTGLGLTIASRLVELMDGKIWVESEVGHGSKFHFTARLLLADEVTRSLSPQLATTLAEVRVLAVDDNATNRLVLTETLRNWRIAAVAAADAAEAFHLLQAAHAAGEPFHLVLTDYYMPEHDGFELIEWMRRDEAVRNTAVIMLTSTDRLGDVARCRQFNVARRLTKPVKQSELFDAILEALRIEHADNDVPQRSPETAPAGLAPLNVLLVEDSLFNQKLAVELLRRQGHRVTVADNGKLALHHLEQDHFDVVLMDVRMPEMDGLTATAAIRQRESLTGGHLPIIAMTAHAMTGDREKCLEAGMDGYLSKPVRAAELIAALQTVVGEPAPASPNAPPLLERAARDSAFVADDPVRFAGPLAAMQDDRELVAEVIELFLRECPRQVEQIREAIRAGKGDRLRLAAHTLKGELRNFTARRASDLAYELECRGRDARFDGAEETLARLQDELDRLTPKLSSFVGKDAEVSSSPDGA